MGNITNCILELLVSQHTAEYLTRFRWDCMEKSQRIMSMMLTSIAVLLLAIPSMIEHSSFIYTTTRQYAYYKSRNIQFMWIAIHYIATISTTPFLYFRYLNGFDYSLYTYAQMFAHTHEHIRTYRASPKNSLIEPI